VRKRIFEIIKIGSREDFISRFCDYFIVFIIILNIIATFMMTFDSLSSLATVLQIVEYVTVGFFIIEYLMRIITADFLYPDEKPWKARLHFLRSFDGVVDLLTILPLVPLLGFVAFRMLRVIRIFHLFRINAQYDSFNIITIVLHEKWKQIASSVLIILIIMLASSMGIYSVEHDAQPDVFQNAFSGMWWSMSTLLTVGYGDLYPITTAGKIMGMIIAFLGVGLVAIPTGIISAGFVEQYSYRNSAGKKYADISEIGEILVRADDEICGKTIEEIEQVGTLRILLVIREELKLIPVGDLIIKEKDIVVVDSKKIIK